MIIYVIIYLVYCLLSTTNKITRKQLLVKVIKSKSCLRSGKLILYLLIGYYLPGVSVCI